MGSNTPGSPQGSYGPTQPVQPPTQYGNTNPYAPPPPYPYPPPNNPQPKDGFRRYGVFAIIVLLVGIIVVLLVRPLQGTSSPPTPTATVAPTATVPLSSTQPSVATQPPTAGGYCGLGTWGSTSVSPNQTVQGPAIINGVYSVNGHNFAVGGTNKVGYIAVLEDSGTYTVNSSGTACQPITGTPSQSDIQTVINAMVQDQRTNGCTGGCSVSRIQKFSGGNPDRAPYNQ